MKKPGSPAQLRVKPIEPEPSHDDMAPAAAQQPNPIPTGQDQSHGGV
jgi:hypothetical protein